MPSDSPPQRTGACPWGHKLTISIYVEGEMPDERSPFAAVEAASDILEQAGALIDFAGVRLEDVPEQPSDQGSAPPVDEEERP